MKTIDYILIFFRAMIVFMLVIAFAFLILETK